MASAAQHCCWQSPCSSAAPEARHGCGACDVILDVCEWVLPGDAQSMTFAKLVTAEMLARAHESFVPCAPRAHVDDVPPVAICLSQAALAQVLQPAASHFVAELAALGFKVSPKTTLSPASSAAMIAITLISQPDAWLKAWT